MPFTTDQIGFAQSMEKVSTVKNPKISDNWKNCYNYPKIGTVLFYYRVMASEDAVWSGSTLFVQIWLC